VDECKPLPGPRPLDCGGAGAGADADGGGVDADGAGGGGLGVSDGGVITGGEHAILLRYGAHPALVGVGVGRLHAWNQRKKVRGGRRTTPALALTTPILDGKHKEGGKRNR